MSSAWRLLEALEHEERLEDLSRRLGLPPTPEYDLEIFKSLYLQELDEVRGPLETLSLAALGPGGLTARGRLRRILGDVSGAESDFRQALDARPGLAAAQAFLGELALGGPQAEPALRAATGAPSAALYLAVDLLMRGRPTQSAAPLAAYRRARPHSALAFLLTGLALERSGRPAAADRAYARAAALKPICSAAHLLRARLARSSHGAARRLTQAYDVSPVMGFVTLQLHRETNLDRPAYVAKMIDFAFSKPETLSAYYRREATQTHFSHFPAEDYEYVSRLMRRNAGKAWAHAFYGRAACYVPSGAAEGIRHLSRAIALSPHSGWCYAWRANARRLVGDLRGAKRDFDAAVKLQPFYHRAYVWRGSLLRKLGRFSEALSDLNRGLVLDPHYSLTYHERSLVRRRLGDIPGALSDLDCAFLLDHRYSWVFKTGGTPDPGQLRLGIEELERAERRNPHLPSLFMWRGQARFQAGDSSGALVDFQTAALMDPHHGLNLGWQGLVLLESGEARRALEPLRKAVVFEPRFQIARSWLARAEFACGRRVQARRILLDVLREKPLTPWARYWLAHFDREEGRLASAERELGKALLIDGKSPEAYLLLAQTRLERGRAAQALAAAEQCLSFAPNVGRALVAKAEALARLGRAEEAVASYRAVLKDFPYLLNEEQRKRAEALLGPQA
ncbi:MAG: tetratricopeptide repeat protein [Elusimicrobia bacterium]|nr:tetratricopeptide repeat protein [Elusimicrobiota bacterium]